MHGHELLAEIQTNFQVIHQRSTKDEIVILCPQCGDQTGNRSINLKTGLTHCWRCGGGGHILSWAKRLGYEINIDQSSSAVPIDELETMAAFKVDTPRPISLATHIRLPRGFILIADQPDSAYAKLIGRMAERKHLAFEDMVESGVGFTRDDVVWEPYAIFPVKEWSITSYYQGRTYVDTPGESTKRFPNRSSVKLGASHWVYNIDEARVKAEVVIVVESILNVLSLRKVINQSGLDNVVPVAIFKHSISSIQEQKILALKRVKEVCIMFDSDSTDHAWDLAHRFVNYRVFSVAEIPPTLGRTTDANDDASMALEQFYKRRVYTVANALEIEAETL